MKQYVHNCILLCVILGLMFVGCSSKNGGSSAPTHDKDAPLRDNTPQVLVPEAPMTTAFTSDVATIEASNTANGYVMVKYSGSNEKVKLQIATPDAIVYTYQLSGGGQLETFPLTGGNGNYQLTVLENVSGDQYAAVLSQDIAVTIADEFAPFLYPNQYVNFTADSKTVAKASELAKDTYSDLEVVANIYKYITKNITYDSALADDVSPGYLPKVDDTLASKKGICFDYAAIMGTMLRSQKIPTKLEVGYSGEAYHAWISTYVDDIGWIDNVIEFDGNDWSLVDPTLAASNDSKNVKKYVGDGKNYLVKYTY